MLYTDIMTKDFQRILMKFDISVPLLGFENVTQVELEKIDDIFMKMQSTTEEHTRIPSCAQ